MNQPARIASLIACGGMDATMPEAMRAKLFAHAQRREAQDKRAPVFDGEDSEIDGQGEEMPEDSQD